MSTRRYTATIRQAQLSERRQRVAAATAELHAEKGVIATTYADIAERAGVSLPTVYSYFPTQAELMSACTSHVRSRAPELPVQAILAARDIHTAAKTLVAGIDKLHAFFEPWVSWRQEKVIGFLEELSQTQREHLKAMVIQILILHQIHKPGAHAAEWESLLSFDLWQRLVRQHGLPRGRVRALLTKLLLAALGPEPSTTANPGPQE